MAPSPHRSYSSLTGAHDITFDVDGEWFTCVPVLPAGALADVVDSASKDSGVQMAAIMGFLDLALEEDSAKRFAARMRSRDKPISLEMAVQVFQDLNEVYGSDRPTGGSSASPPGSTLPGPPSTGGARPATSTP